MAHPAIGGGAEDRAGRIAVFVLGAALFLQGPLVAVAPLGMAPLAIAAGVLVSVLHGLRGGALPSSWLARALFMVCLLGAASCLVSIAPGRTPATAAAMAAVVLPGLVLVSVAASAPAGRFGRIVENAFIAGLGLGLALVLIQMVLGHSFGELLGSKPLLNHITPKIVSRPGSLFALAVWPAAIMLYRRGRRDWALWLPMGFTAVSVLFHHRATAMAMIVALGVHWAATRAPVLTRRALGVLLAVLFVAAVPIADGLERAGLEDARWLPNSARHRVEIWQFAAERALARPLVGHGLDASAALINGGQVSRFQEPGANVLPLHPHNLFLQVWLELGVPGAIAALAAALGMLAAVARVAPGPLQPFALAGFAGYWIFAATAYGAWQAWWLGTAVMAATALAFACRPDREEEAKP